MNLKRISLVLAVCAAVSPALGVTPEARGLAMGDAYSPFAKGAEGVWYNPATLGAVTLAGVDGGVGLEASNNSLTLMEMVNLSSGSGSSFYKSLDKIKDKWNGDLKIVGGGALDVLGVGIGFSPHVQVIGKDISRDALEMGLSKNHDMRIQSDGIYEMTGLAEVSSFSEISVGYGRELPVPLPIGKLSAGAAVKIYKGISYTAAGFNGVINTTALTNTTTNSLATSTSGKGLGFDLGAHAEFAVVDASLSIKNIASVISWDTEVQSGAVNPATLKMSPTVTKETYKQTLPMTVALGVGGHIPIIGTAAGAELEMVGKGTTKGKTGDAIDTSDAVTRLRIGMEQSLMGILNIRAGYITGGKGMVTLGAGLGALIARLDAGVGIGLDGKSGSAGLSGSVSF